MAWPAARVAVEYDGVEFHSSRAQLHRDRARSAWLLDQGWPVLQVTGADVRLRPGQLVDRVLWLLERATSAGS